MAAPPFAKKDDKSDMGSPSGGASSHLDALEKMAKTARAHAAIRTLRAELTSGDASKRKPGNTSDAKSEALARFGAKS